MSQIVEDGGTVAQVDLLEMSSGSSGRVIQNRINNYFILDVSVRFSVNRRFRSHLTEKKIRTFSNRSLKTGEPSPTDCKSLFLATVPWQFGSCWGVSTSEITA